MVPKKKKKCPPGRKNHPSWKSLWGKETGLGSHKPGESWRQPGLSNGAKEMDLREMLEAHFVPHQSVYPFLRGSTAVTHHSTAARKCILPLASASYSKQNLLLCTSVSPMLSCTLSYICMHTLSFCKHNLDFSKQWQSNEEKLRRACVLNIDSSFSHTTPDIFHAALFLCICFLCFPMSCPTLKESAANKQLGPPLTIEGKHHPRPTLQKNLLITS